MPPAFVIVRRVSMALIFVGACASSPWWAPKAYDKYARPATRMSSPAAPAPEARKVDTWIVKKGEFKITFTESGKLRAIKSYPIFPAISRQQLKITFLATEGSTVKKGDLVVSFDKKSFDDQLQTHKADLDAALRTKTVNEAALEIAKSTSVTTTSQALIKLDDAKVAYKTYIELEGPKKLNDLETLINDAKGKLTTGQKTVTDAQQKIDDGLFSEDQEKQTLEKAQADAKESARTLQKTVDALVLQRKIFRTYEYPQTIKSKKQASDSAQMDVEKAKISGENDINQKQAELAKTEDTIRRLKREMETLQDQLSKCDITAPVSGLVVYGDPTNPYRVYGQEIKVGADWYGGQTLMTIPDLSAFEIDINVAEDYVARIKSGMPVTVTFEAVPDVRLTGKLKDIAKLGRPREQYDPTSPRVFLTSITLNGSDSRLVSGMTARVEILADHADSVLLVPTDAIATESGKTIVMLRTDNGRLDRREVAAGRANNNYVEIVKGLIEGDRVALGVPADSMSAK
jgi:HlyD family secretion protein